MLTYKKSIGNVVRVSPGSATARLALETHKKTVRMNIIIATIEVLGDSGNKTDSNYHTFVAFRDTPWDVHWEHNRKGLKNAVVLRACTQHTSIILYTYLQVHAVI
ncbi:unnamed protein product [Allacma fusca]|uniref:Uncharacterized protein n=1 Tax=Allacma fusca TaxID=39272 RepID=A0A8J2JNL7_9HEXA|nr:unnamed protein product [Allacma fusca]